MAIATTVSAINCVPVCTEIRALSESQFMLMLIDKLADEAGIDLADITTGDLLSSVEDGICELQDRTAFYNASPEQVRAIAYYLLTQVVG